MTQKGLASNLGGGLQISRFTLGYGDCTAAAVTQTVPLFTLPKGSIVLGIRIKHSTAFAGTSVTGFTVSVGSTNLGVTGLASAFNAFQAVADGTRQVTGTFKDGANADEVINAYLTSVGANLSVMAAGSVDIDVIYINNTTPL